MAKRSKKRKGSAEGAPADSSGGHASVPETTLRLLATSVGIPLLLAIITFTVYWPSLQSDFVYDAREEILEEGFISNISNLPKVLSLHVLSMNLMLGPRPGTLLYLMLNAALWGKEPFGYHLYSNLLHAANVALLVVLLLRLVKAEYPDLTTNAERRVRLAIIAVTLIFALHPLAVEAVSAINYCSDLLMTFFTLAALLVTTTFKPENTGKAWASGIAGTLCAFAAVTCKESGAAVPLLLITYWLLFRRSETKGPWLGYLGTAVAATAIFLAARFLLAPAVSGSVPTYLGGSFFQVFLIQPRLWVFMMGKLVWPVGLSADYTLENMDGLSTLVAVIILVGLVALQIWLASKSKIGALGFAMYWSGLATVSNFIPLYCLVADRYYYLSLAGLALQILALLLMLVRFGKGYWLAIALCLIAALPLTLLTFKRETVFANELSLWSDTLQVSPLSWRGRAGLGALLLKQGKVNEAIIQFQQALEINPHDDRSHNNLGGALLRKGHLDEAIFHFQRALEIEPNFATVHYNLGWAFSQKGQIDAAISQFQMTLDINPNFIDAYNSLGDAFVQEGQLDKAMIQFQKALKLNPNNATVHNNLGIVFFQKGDFNEATAQFQEAVRLDPNLLGAQNDLNKAQAMVRQMPASTKAP